MVTPLARLAAEGGDWVAAGHDLSRAWYELLGTFGPWVLLAVLVAAILRALVRAGRYRIESVMSPADREPVQAALREVESRTRGEVVPVVVGRSDPHPAAGWRAAVAVLAVGSALLLPHLPWNQPALFLLCQLVLGVAGYGIARWLPDFQRLFVSEQRATAVAQEQALQEFFGNRLFETRERTGVLLFVSLLEHRVVVLADQGVDERVGAEHWAATDRAILEGVRRGALQEGLVAGVHLAGEVLARHFPLAPGEADPNELPDRLIVRPE
jgi:putative membrane protein